MMPPTFPRNIQCAVLWYDPTRFALHLRGFHPLRQSHPSELRLRRKRAKESPKHHIPPKGFGLPFTLFTRGYSGHRYCFLFLPLLRCFSSEGSRSSRSDGRSRQEVPFGYPRIKDCMRLPEAYRSLPRPSSLSKPSHPPNSVAISKYPGSHGWSQSSIHGLIENHSSPMTDPLALHP